MAVRVEFEPASTWMLDERLEALLEAVRFETDHVAVEVAGGEALLVSTEASGVHAHVAVLHRRDSLGGVSTAAPPGTDDPLRASFQHDSTPRTDSVKRALYPFRLRRPLEH